MLLPTAVSDILKIVEKLKNGADIRKCKVDHKQMPVESGQMKAEDSLSAVKITCAYKDGAATHNIEAHHPKDDQNNVVKINNAEMDAADINMRLVFTLAGVDVKATLEYQKDGAPHTIELYARIANVI